MSRGLPNANQTVRKMNPHAYKEVMKPDAHGAELRPILRAAVNTGGAQSVKNTRRSVEERLNKTERRWLEMMRVRRHCAKIGIQEITFRLANQVRYTPDFSVTLLDHMKEQASMVFYEIKGAYIREDAWIKLKTAASLFPQFRFVMAQWKDNRWTDTEIKP
jgi:hypothetical protein